MSDSIVARLEAVAAKLEAFAASNPTPSACPASGSSGSASSGPSAKVAAFDSFYSASVQPFIDAANSVEGTKIVVSI